VIGQERFDDPLRQYRVLYAAAQRAGCFAETLAAFRPSLASLAAERAVLNTGEPLRTAHVPAAWWRNRLMATFRLVPGRWLDLRTLTTFQVLREEFSGLASSLGLADVDLSVMARRTPGFTGADLANVINEAALLTARTGGLAVGPRRSRRRLRLRLWSLGLGLGLVVIGGLILAVGRQRATPQAACSSS